MKRLLITLTVLGFALASLGQLTYGPKVGLNISKYGFNYIDSGLEPDMKFKMGGSVGAVMNLQINSFLAFQPSLSFTKKGSSYDLGSDESGSAILTGYDRMRVAYLELPLNIAAGIRLGSGQIQLFAGPYLAFGVCGKRRWDYEENVNGNRTQYTDSQKIKFKGTVPEGGHDDDVMYQKPFDFGFDFGLGYKYNQLLFNLGFAMGLANLQPGSSTSEFDAKDFKYANRTVFLTAAWLFGDE